MSGGRVVILESDGLLRGQMARVAGAAGMEPIECAGLDEVRACCRGPGPAVVVADWGLVGAAGRSFCEALRRGGEGSGPVVIAVVDDVSGRRGEVLLACGVDDFLLRPVNMEVLEVRLRLAALRGHGQPGSGDWGSGMPLLRQLVDAAVDMVVAADAERRIIEFNNSAMEGFGCRREDVIGKVVDILFAEPEEGRRLHRTILETGACSGEVTNQRRDGNWFVSEVRGMPLVRPGGMGAGVTLVLREITRQRAAERALRESELRYRAIVDDQMELITRSDVLGRLTFANRAFGRQFGVAPEVVVGRDQMEFVCGPDQPIVRDMQSRLTPESPVAVYEHRVGSHSGGISWVLRTDHGIFGTGGVLWEVQSVCRDITEQRQTQATLLESEARYRLLFDVNPTAAWVFDRKTLRFLVVNDAAVERYGYSREEFLAMGMEDLHHEEDRPALRQFLRGVSGGVTRAGVWRQKRKDGTAIHVESLCHPFSVAGRQGLLVVAHDVTDLKLAEDSLRTNEARYRKLLESTHAVPWEADPVTHRFLYVGPQAGELLHFPAEEWLRDGFWVERLHPGDRDAVLARWGAAAGEAREVVTEHRMVARDGRTVWVRQVGSMGLDVGGQPVLRGFMMDITDRRVAEEGFQRVTRAVETTSDPICITDAMGNVLHRNPAFTGAFGEGAAEIEGGAGLAGLFLDQGVGDHVLEAFRSGSSWSGQVVMRLKDARRGNLLLRMDGIRDAGGNIIGSVWVFSDLAGRMALDAELLRSSKLESIGLLAGGIAHDFNNLLLVIGGNLALAKMECQEDSPMLPVVSEAEKAVERAAELAKQLLTFAKGGAPVRKPVVLSQLLNETVKFNLHGSKADGDLVCAKDLWTVMIDEGQIVQAITNLVINATEAMPKGGMIRVSASNRVLADGELSMLPAGNYVHIRVSDEGCGIPPEIVDKIFDPYFSTKAHGSGLGLATAYSIIRKHDGLITVESEPGVGTTFEIFLPALLDSPVMKRTTPESALLTTRFLLREGKGKVLVMDDEPGVRLTMVKALQRLGYDGHPARDGQEAMQLFRDALGTDAPFDTAILDLTLPRGPGGEEVVREMRQMQPDFRAIAFSGYAENPVIANFREYGFSAALSKPFHIEELGRKLAYVLRKRRSPSGLQGG